MRQTKRTAWVLGATLLLGCSDNGHVVGDMAAGGSGGQGPSSSSSSQPTGTSGSTGGSSANAVSSGNSDGGTAGTSTSVTSGSSVGGATNGAGGAATATDTASNSTGGVATSSGGAATTDSTATTGGTGGTPACPDGQMWCPGCNVGEGFCGVACPGAQCPECSTVDNEADCDARADCHSVLEDPGTCGCAPAGCCTRFSFCAPGFSADCDGGTISCAVQAPFCDTSVSVLSYAGGCYEGCVRPEICAASSSTTGAGGAGGEVCPCDAQTCPNDEVLCLMDGECVVATGPLDAGICRAADGTCFSCECASPDTPIATAGGNVPIRDLRVGDLVYSVDASAIKLVPIRAVNRVPVSNHRVLRVEFAGGAHFEMSGGHPTAGGRTLAELQVGDELLGQRITSIQLIPYHHPFTYDILPDSDTGSYFAAGVLVGSTLMR